MFITVFCHSGLGNFILRHFLSAAELVCAVGLGVLVGARTSPSAPRQELLKSLQMRLGKRTLGAAEQPQSCRPTPKQTRLLNINGRPACCTEDVLSVSAGTSVPDDVSEDAQNFQLENAQSGQPKYFGEFGKIEVMLPKVNYVCSDYLVRDPGNNTTN